MRILQKWPREGRVRLKPENLDDLWELTHIIERDDRLRGHTERKIAMGGDRAKQVRKPMVLTIAVTEVQLDHDTLRVQGTIEDGPEDLVSFGDHHSFSIGAGAEFELTKQWDAVVEKRLEKALETQPLDILLVTFDRESAVFAELTRRGYNIVLTLSGEVAKKAPGGGSEDFWRTIADAVVELDGRREYSSIIAASPAFWNDYLLRALPEAQRKKTTTASCSAVGEAGIREVLKRPELTVALEKDRSSQEESLLDRVLAAVAKDKACYGMEDCRGRAELGQVAMLIVSDALVETSRADGTFEDLDGILEQVKSTGGEVHLTRHATKQLDALGGIAGVLRW